MSSPVGKLQKEKPLVKRIQPPFTRMTTLEGHPIRAADGSRCQRQLEVRSGELHQRDPRQETHMPEVSKPSSSSSSGKLLWLLKRKGSYNYKPRGNNQLISPSNHQVCTQDQTRLSHFQAHHIPSSRLNSYELEHDFYNSDLDLNPRGYATFEQESLMDQQDRLILDLEHRLSTQETNIQNYRNRITQLSSDLKKCDDEIAQLQSRAQLAKNLQHELAVVRLHLRVGDEDEPWVITKEFGEINKSTERISFTLATKLSETRAKRRLNTSDLVEGVLLHLGRNRPFPSVTAYEIDPDEFIELGCRSMLNALLIRTVLDHQVYDFDWESSTNQVFYSTYQSIQKNEVQVNAGRWRISTFNAIKNNDIYPFCRTEVERFCKDALMPYCQVAYDKESCSSAKDAILPAIIALLEKAHAWNYRTRSTVLMLDFEAIYYWPGDKYNSKWAKQEDAEVKPTASETIMLTSQLGLRSCKALGHGNLQYICQTPAVVLGNDYFRD
ncbi:hypothetical protein OPQ81_002631 [Rhizoctonia solani]|nr:hypothetical protein OPQ81_002631 [Rhizoctonia solani]